MATAKSKASTTRVALGTPRTLRPSRTLRTPCTPRTPRTSGHRQRSPVDMPKLADHQLVREVLLLTDVLEQLGAGFEPQVHRATPRLRVGTGIVDGHVVTDRGLISTGELLEGVQLVGVRRRTAVDPEALVVANGIDDQRVTFPPANRVAVVGWLQILRVAPAVHVNRAEGVRTADVEDEDALDFRNLENLCAVGRQELTLHSRRLAPRVRLELVEPAILGDRLRPRLIRNLRTTTAANAATANPYAFFVQLHTT